MAVRKDKPTTPGRRGASVSGFDEVTRGADYFVNTAPADTKANPELDAILEKFLVVARGENWTVYDLRDR